MYSENCIFCKIAKGEIPVNAVFENEKVIAFNDLNPQAPVHVLVIPKDHYASLNEIDDKGTLGEFFAGVKETVKKLNISEYRTVVNTGKSAGQEVFHLHVHILSGREMKWPPG